MNQCGGVPVNGTEARVVASKSARSVVKRMVKRMGERVSMFFPAGLKSSVQQLAHKRHTTMTNEVVAAVKERLARKDIAGASPGEGKSSANKSH